MTETYHYREKKIVAVLSNRLEPGVALNVLGHLALSLGASPDNDFMGRRQLLDASGVSHRGIAKYPVIVTQVKPGTVRKALEQARSSPHLQFADYPKQMLETGHDDELADAVGQMEEKNMEYLGALIYGPSSDVDAITGKFSLWK